MISLFIDTSTSRLIIGVLRDKKVIDIINIEVHNDLSSKVLPNLKEMLDNLNINIKDVEEIYCVNGPGSFTGVRVGVTICKTIAWSLKKKIYPVSSLCLMASGCEKKYAVSMIDARRGYVFAGMYDKKLKSIIPDQYIKLEDLYKILKKDYDLNDIEFISYDKIDDTMKPNIDLEKLLEKGKFIEVNPHQLNPNYLKKTEAEEKLNA